MDVLEQLSVSSPRKSRKSVRSLLESVEDLSEHVDADWCDGASRCDSDRLADVVSNVLAVQGMTPDTGADKSVAIVSSLLEALRVCGSVVVRPAERIRETVEMGGEASVELLKRILDNAVELLEQQAAASPRETRRCMLALAERLESYAESVDADWCDRVRQAGPVSYTHLTLPTKA